MTNDARLDAVFHALADRTRRALLARLRQGPVRVTDLAKPFDMALPTVSKHIRVLEAAGLIARTVEGRVHQCALATAPLQDADAWIAHYRQFWDETLEALAAYAESPPAAPRRTNPPSAPRRR
ncbi:MAG TPA: metalloregulator ArsR/SmtB family transcription factor [bacterium]